VQLAPIFDARLWAAVPFHFWTAVFFILGSLVGSFLNVCIHRMPRGESVISPPSHCPHCGYSIPWYLNLPLLTWVVLGGRCRNCGARIAVRYVLVEVLTAVLFASCWLAFGRSSTALALIYSGVLAGFVVATFIDLEHLIIPDEITLGGIAAGVLASAALPALHGAASAARSLEQSMLGALVGAGVVYAILRLGKLMYGRHDLDLGGEAVVLFTETSVRLPTEEVPYEELFYRGSDRIEFRARRVEMPDRCYFDTTVRLSQKVLQVGDDRFEPESVEWMAVLTDRLTVPREAMGLGDVKFMAAIGAFLGWQAVFFSLMVSAFLGGAVGVVLIACRKREWSSRLPYGPYIALAATGWIFFGSDLLGWWLGP
jgi:leader peptidase (prepilin peptidase) / N-methyltransferase